MSALLCTMLYAGNFRYCLGIDLVYSVGYKLRFHKKLLQLRISCFLKDQSSGSR